MRAQPLSGAGLGSDGMRPRAIEAANKVILRNHRCCFCENVIVAGRLSPAREPHDGLDCLPRVCDVGRIGTGRRT